MIDFKLNDLNFEICTSLFKIQTCVQFFPFFFREERINYHCAIALITETKENKIKKWY